MEIPKYGNDGQFYKTGFQQVRFGEAGPTYGLEKFLGERAEIWIFENISE